MINIDTQTNTQKRKRVNTLQDTVVNKAKAGNEDTIIVDTLRYGLPCNIEDDSNDSDIDQIDHEILQDSTLF